MGRHFTAATQALNTSCSKLNSTERISPQEAKHAWENSSLSFMEVTLSYKDQVPLHRIVTLNVPCVALVIFSFTVLPHFRQGYYLSI